MSSFPVIIMQSWENEVDGNSVSVEDDTNTRSGTRATVAGLAVRLMGGRNPQEGRIEVASIESGSNTSTPSWLPVCGDGLDLRTGGVVCRHLSFGFAYHAFATSRPLDSGSAFPSTRDEDPMIRLQCSGREALLTDCRRIMTTKAACSPHSDNWGSVICTPRESSVSSLLALSHSLLTCMRANRPARPGA